MSRASVVVRQYETAAGLSERFSVAISDLIKVQRRLSGADQVSGEQFASNCRTVSGIVLSIERLVTDDRGATVTQRDLARVRAHLEHVPAQLDDEDLSILEWLSQVLDAETSHLFQRISHETESR